MPERGAHRVRGKTMNKIIMKDQWDMDLIGRVLSRLLSQQYDEEITVRFTPKNATIDDVRRENNT